MPFLDTTKLREPQVSAFCRRNRATSPLIQLGEDTNNRWQRAGIWVRRQGRVIAWKTNLSSLWKWWLLLLFFYSFLFNKSEASAVKFNCSFFFLTPVACWMWVFSPNPFLFRAHNVLCPHAKQKEKGHCVSLLLFLYCSLCHFLSIRFAFISCPGTCCILSALNDQQLILLLGHLSLWYPSEAPVPLFGGWKDADLILSLLNIISNVEALLFGGFPGVLIIFIHSLLQRWLKAM